MRYDDLYISGAGSWYPESISVDDAVADGRYSATVRSRTGQRRVTIAGPDDASPDMAVRAGISALGRAGCDPAEVSLLLHAVATYNGMDGWNCASYLQHRILAGHGVSFELRQLSNGAVGAIELAAAYLRAGGGAGSALITTADQFALPAWNRWEASPGLVFGDGASALLLSRDSGFARVVSSVSICDPELEGMQRGTRPFRSFADPDFLPSSIVERTKEFAATISIEEAVGRMAVGLNRAVTEAVKEAGTSVEDVAHVVLPNFGRELLHDECLVPIGADIERTTWRWGNTVGHVGAADQFGGLDHLATQGLLKPGERVMLVGVGGGFNWTCVVLEILTEPGWAHPAENGEAPA